MTKTLDTHEYEKIIIHYEVEQHLLDDHQVRNLDIAEFDSLNWHKRFGRDKVHIPDLGTSDLTALHAELHGKYRATPSETPVMRIDKYEFRVVDTFPQASVQIFQRNERDGRYYSTPGRWYADSLTNLSLSDDPRLFIDYGQGWYVAGDAARALGYFASMAHDMYPPLEGVG